jgi:hypothetical protein
VYFLFDILFPSNSSPPTIGRCPPTCSNPRTPPLQHPFYHGCQLLVDCCVLIDRWLPKVTVYFLFNIFFPLNLSPPTIGRRPPTRSNPHAPPLQDPFYRGRQLLVDCCVLPINGSHLRLMHHFPLHFLMWFILVSQMGTNQHGKQ